MPPPSDDTRIRTGLKSLKKFDVQAIRAAIIINKVLEGPDPGSPGDFVKRRTFYVEHTTYVGFMTDEQYTFLNGYLASKYKFANAIAKVLILLDQKLRHAFDDINDALTMTTKAKKAESAFVVFTGKIPPAKSGCCTYDGGEMDVTTQATCTNLGSNDWKEDQPCRKIVPGKR